MFLSRVGVVAFRGRRCRFRGPTSSLSGHVVTSGDLVQRAHWSRVSPANLFLFPRVRESSLRLWLRLWLLLPLF